MALTILTTLREKENGTHGAQGRYRLVFDTSYPTGGEAFDFTTITAPAFVSVTSILCDLPKLVDGDRAALTTCSSVMWDRKNGKFIAYVEDGTSGVEAEVGNGTNLSTIHVDVTVNGT